MLVAKCLLGALVGFGAVVIVAMLLSMLYGYSRGNHDFAGVSFGIFGRVFFFGEIKVFVLFEISLVFALLGVLAHERVALPDKCVNAHSSAFDDSEK